MRIKGFQKIKFMFFGALPAFVFAACGGGHNGGDNSVNNAQIVVGGNHTAPSNGNSSISISANSSPSSSSSGSSVSSNNTVSSNSGSQSLPSSSSGNNISGNSAVTSNSGSQTSSSNGSSNTSSSNITVSNSSGSQSSSSNGNSSNAISANSSPSSSSSGSSVSSNNTVTSNSGPQSSSSSSSGNNNISGNSAVTSNSGSQTSSSSSSSSASGSNIAADVTSSSPSSSTVDSTPATDANSTVIPVATGSDSSVPSDSSSSGFSSLESAYGQALGVVSDSGGNSYLLGPSHSSPGSSPSSADWQIKKSSDGGKTWSVLDSSVNYSSPTTASALALDHSGGIYLVGTVDVTMPDSAQSGNDIKGTQWFLKFSSDGGKTWKTLQVTNKLSRKGSSPTSIATDAYGNIFVSGIVQHDERTSWIVLKSPDQGKNWEAVDHGKKFSEKGDSSAAYGLAIDGNGQIFVAGTADSKWIVRRSSDEGRNWSTVDKTHSGSSAIAHGVTVDSNGNIFVTGQISDKSERHWYTRKSSNGGDTWSAVDDFAPGAYGLRIFSDRSGNLYATGIGLVNGNAGNSQSHYLIRKSSDSGNSWDLMSEEFKLNNSVEKSFALND